MLTTERTGVGLAGRAELRAARDLVARRVDAEAARAAVWPFLATRLAFVVIGLAAPLLFSDHATRTPFSSLRALLPAALMPLAVAAHLAYLWRGSRRPPGFLHPAGALHG